MYKQATPFRGKDGNFHSFYVVVSDFDDKVYFGKHSRKEEVSDYLGSGVYIQRAIQKYGRERFKRIDLAFFDSEELAFQYEGLMVDEAVVLSGKTYNLIPGGSRTRGIGVSAPWSKESPMKGKKRTEEDRLAIIEGLRSYYEQGYSEEQRIARSASAKDAASKRTSYARGFSFNHTEEAKRKISESSKARADTSVGLQLGRDLMKERKFYENSMAGKSSESTKKMLLRLDEIYEIWLHNGKPGYSSLCKLCDSEAVGFMQNLVKRFNSGFDPRVDVHYQEWKNARK
jgi:hypothetical protein